MTLNFTRFGLPLVAILLFPVITLAGEAKTEMSPSGILAPEITGEVASTSNIDFNVKFKTLENIHFSVFKKYSDTKANSKFDGLIKRKPVTKI
ncbi:MAG: hypothetical protein JKY04_08670 [Sneathiella sp.]|nr:hypothetical protein [Sneathiella sp.]